MKTDFTTLDLTEAAHWDANAGLYFSQLGEDCLLWHLFSGKWEGFYVDVGCHHPYRYSNTYLLHRFRKWRGINIDADIRAIELFRAARPHDINLHCGVGLEAGIQSLTVFSDGAVNTFVAELAARQSSHYSVAGQLDVPVLPLASILEQHLTAGTEVDLINIDCEGYDDAVVASNNWTKYGPRIVLVEIHGMNLENPMAAPTAQLLKAAGYILRAHYFATSIFERVGS
jgi:FkbM family methyltransferase